MEFHIEHGGKVNPIEFVREMVNLYSDIKIYVGCDSQNKRKECLYAIVIAFRFTYGEEGTRKGARFIYATEVTEKMPDKFTRLWGEVERSTALAQKIEDRDVDGNIRGFKVDVIDLDFNHKDTTGSYDLVASGSGYVKGYGFESTCKPEEQIASRAADHIVKKKNKKERRFHFKKKKKGKAVGPHNSIG